MPEIGPILDEVVADVLEKMFFSVVLGPGGPAAGESCMTAVVSFSGAHAGALCVCAGAKTVTKLAESFLGEETVAESQVSATFGELANVLCGGVLGRIHPDGRFTISAPRVFCGWDCAAVLDTLQIRRSYEIEEGVLNASFAIG
jgi:CheY-specific phosphatase CheX